MNNSFLSFAFVRKPPWSAAKIGKSACFINGSFAMMAVGNRTATYGAGDSFTTVGDSVLSAIHAESDVIRLTKQILNMHHPGFPYL